MKKFLFAFICVLSLSLFSGCDLFNKTRDALDDTARDMDTAMINGLEDFHSEIKKLGIDATRSSNDYANYGAVDGYQISSGTYVMNVYKFDKDSDEYRKFYNDQKIYTDEASGIPATVRGGYAIIIGEDFPKKDRIMDLFNRLQ